jgi:hypothetical protein
MRQLNLMLFFLCACGGGKDGETTSVNTSSVTIVTDDGVSVTTSLKGTWQSPCRDEDGLYSRDVVVFDQINRTRKIGYFTDKSCSQKFLEYLTVFSFSIGKKIEGLTNTYEIDFSVEKIEATAITDEAVGDLNTYVSFGYDDWKKGVTKDIAGKPDVPNRGQKILSIIKIDSVNEIFEGQGDDDEDYMTRPTELSSTSIKRL